MGAFLAETYQKCLIGLASRQKLSRFWLNMVKSFDTQAILNNAKAAQHRLQYKRLCKGKNNVGI
jgi:hypothetical protein